MYCNNCSKELVGFGKYCQSCGAKQNGVLTLSNDKAVSGQASSQHMETTGGLPQKLKANSKMLKIVLLIIAAAIVLGGVIILILNILPESQRELSVAELLDLGEKYLLDLNYEQALVQFMGVIEIEPRNPGGYIGAAKAYIGLGDTESAIAILEQGLAAIPNNAEIIACLEMVSPKPNPRLEDNNNTEFDNEQPDAVPAQDTDGNINYFAESLISILNAGSCDTVRAILTDLDDDGMDEMVTFEWNMPHDGWFETNVRVTVFDVENGRNLSSSVDIFLNIYVFSEIYISDKGYIIDCFSYENNEYNIYEYKDGTLSHEASIYDYYDVMEDILRFEYNSNECSETYFNEMLSYYGVYNYALVAKKYGDMLYNGYDYSYQYYERANGGVVPTERNDLHQILAMADIQTVVITLPMNDYGLEVLNNTIQSSNFKVLLTITWIGGEHDGRTTIFDKPKDSNDWFMFGRTGDNRGVSPEFSYERDELIIKFPLTTTKAYHLYEDGTGRYMSPDGTGVEPLTWEFIAF